MPHQILSASPAEQAAVVFIGVVICAISYATLQCLRACRRQHEANKILKLEVNQHKENNYPHARHHARHL